MRTIIAKVTCDKLRGTLFEALNNLRRVYNFGRPDEQMKELGHQSPADDAEILLLARHVGILHA